MSVRIGAIEVAPLLDAVGTLAELEQAYPDVEAQEWAPYRELYPELFAGSRWRLPVKIHLIRSGGTTVLVDTGVGPRGSFPMWRGEREGLLPSALAVKRTWRALAGRRCLRTLARTLAQFSIPLFSAADLGRLRRGKR